MTPPHSISNSGFEASSISKAMWHTERQRRAVLFESYTWKGPLGFPLLVSQFFGTWLLLPYLTTLKKLQLSLPCMAHSECIFRSIPCTICAIGSSWNVMKVTSLIATVLHHFQLANIVQSDQALKPLLDILSSVKHTFRVKHLLHSVTNLSLPLL